MVKFYASIPDDIPQIKEWIEADPDHAGKVEPVWWLTGMSHLSFGLEDEKGPVLYGRVDKEEDVARLHIQFAPQHQVSRRRVARGILKGLPVLLEYLKKEFKAVLFESRSPELVGFMKNMGFEHYEGTDYRLEFPTESVDVRS